MSKQTATKEELYRKHGKELRRYLWRLTSSNDDADDLTQETFLRFLKIEDQSAIRKPRSILYRIARNLSIDALRRRRLNIVDERVECKEDKMLHPSPDPEEQLAAKQDWRIFCAAVISLPQQRRRVFAKRKFEHLSYKDIAEELGISVRTVETHLAKAMRDVDVFMRRHQSEMAPDAGEVVRLSERKRQRGPKDV